MPIHYQKKIIFIHIPKTGGTSISKMLFGNTHYSHQHLLGPVINVKGKPRRASHCTFEEIQSILQFNIEEFDKITCVRNPYDRIKSEYYFLKKNNVIHPALGDVKKLTFKDFLIKLEKEFETLEKKCYNIWSEDYFIHFLPQIEFLRVGKEIIDTKIFRFEKFEEVEKYFNNKVHLNYNPLNRIKDYKKEYDEEMVEIVQKLYKEDLEYFGYEF
jgi:REP element-mobilizing transposase RayT